MKKFIIRIFVFLATILILFVLTNKLQSHYNEEPQFYKLQYNAAENTLTHIDGIIIGTSHALNSMRPTILDSTGISFYNFSLLGAGPTFYYDWYNEWYLKNRPAPRYCIIGIDLFMFDSGWVWRHFEQDSEFFSTALFLKLLLGHNKFNKKDMVFNRYPALKYRKSMLKSLRFQKGDERFPLNYYDRGYLSFQAPYDSTKFKFTKNYSIDSIQLNIFKKLIAQMVSDNVQLVFVMSPEYGFTPEYHASVYTYRVVDDLAKKYGIPVLNFNTKLRSHINEDISLFNDWGHMSVKGSMVFSSQLTKEMYRLGFHQ